MSAPDLRSHAVPKISLASMGASTDVISLDLVGCCWQQGHLGRVLASARAMVVRSVVIDVVT